MSADTTASSHASGFSSSSQTLHAGPYTPLKSTGLGEGRNRPHSYSGGLSSADLVRLQHAGGSPGAPDNWSSPNGTPDRPGGGGADQPTYPSITQSGFSRSQEQQLNLAPSRADDTQGDYQASSRQFSLFGQNQQATVSQGPYTPTRAHLSNQQARTRGGFSPQVSAVLQSPPSFAYPTPLQPTPLPVSGGQQIYDMMLPTPPLENPAMARLQQQTPYRPGHQHSASDPASQMVSQA